MNYLLSAVDRALNYLSAVDRELMNYQLSAVDMALMNYPLSADRAFINYLPDGVVKLPAINI